MALNDIPASSHYPTLFRTFILQILKGSLMQIAQSADALPRAVCDQALHTLTFALKLDEAWHLTRTLLLELAPKLEQMGYRDDWLPYLEQGSEQARRCADEDAVAELHLHIGHLHRLCSRFADAQHHLTVSLAIFIQAERPSGQARALNHLAYLAWQRHCHDEARHLAKQALSLLSCDDTERATSFTTLGEIARTRRQWRRAQFYHRRALEIRRTQRDQRRMAWSLQNLGHTLWGEGHLAETIDYYEQALAMLEERQDLFHWAIAAMNLAIVYYQQQQFAQALDYYTQAEAIFHRIHSTLYLAKIAVNKGLVFLALCDWTQAEQAFNSSGALFRNLNDLGEALNAQDGLGLTYLYQGRFPEASAVFAQALHELAEIADSPLYATLQQELTDHWRQAQTAQASGVEQTPAPFGR